MHDYDLCPYCPLELFFLSRQYIFVPSDITQGNHVNLKVYSKITHIIISDIEPELAQWVFEGPETSSYEWPFSYNPS